LALSRGQAGVLSRQQVAGFGLSDTVISRLVGQGWWRPVTRGVYALAPDSFLQRAWAGVLVGGQWAVLGQLAAGSLHGLIPTEPDQICVYTGADHQVTRSDPRWLFVRSDRLGVGEPARTRLAQTIIDLAALLDGDDLAGLVARALGSRRVSAQQVLNLLDDYPRLRHRALLAEALGGFARGAHSPLEVRYERDVERAHGLPTASRQVRVSGSSRCDACYELYRLIVELDGLAYHLNKVADMERDNQHLIAGFRTLRFGWTHVTQRPCWVAAQVATALTQAGWPGTPHPCPRCR
jgi:very-short-patch-repair endonuclease